MVSRGVDRPRLGLVSVSPARRAPWRALTDAATDRHAVFLRVKVVPVPATAAVKEGRALSFSQVKVPAGDHGAARPGLGLLRAHLYSQETRRNQV